MIFFDIWLARATEEVSGLCCGGSLVVVCTAKAHLKAPKIKFMYLNFGT